MSISFVRVTAPGEEDCNDWNGQEIVPTLPAVLGRGSLLKCGDKRISRKHAYLDWDDDAVMLTSVHQNPTFVIAKGVEKVLTEGDSCLLCHGDYFGLLKTNFWYKINLPNTCPEEPNSPEADSLESRKSIESAPKMPTKPETHSKNFSGKKDEANGTTIMSVPTNHVKENEEEELVPAINENVAISEGKKITTKDLAPELSNISLSSGENDLNMQAEGKKENYSHQSNTVRKSVKATLSVKEIQKGVISRKRELPAWLKNINPSENTTSPNKETQNCHGGSRKSRPSTTKTKLSKTVSADSGVEDSVVKQTYTSQNGKRQELHDQRRTPKIKMNISHKNKGKSPSPRKNAPSCTPKGSTVNNRTKGLHVMSDDSEESQILALTPKNSTSTQKKNDTPQKMQSPKVRSPVKHDISDDDEESSDNENEAPAATNAVIPARNTTRKAPSPKKRPRQNCQFGASCYRKNPKHLADFAHVGDSDYKETASDSEDDDDRPQCEHGIDCYRKNPQHRKDFRHSRVPQPQRRAKRKARQQKQRDDSSNSDEYDYDDPFLNDDSSDDYAPTDSDDDSPMEADGEEEDTKRMLKEGKKFVRKR